FILERGVGILEIARQRARAGSDGLEYAALMLRKHLLELTAERIAIGNTQEYALDVLVGAQRLERCIERARLGTVEAEFADGLARHVDNQRASARGELPLVKIGKERRFRGEVARTRQGACGQHDMLTLGAFDAGQLERKL